MTRVMLLWTVFVESANKPENLYLQRTAIRWISSVLKRLKTQLIRNWWVWQWMHVFPFLYCFYSIYFKNISNFMSNLFHYVFKYYHYCWSNNYILSSFTMKIAFLWVSDIFCHWHHYWKLSKIQLVKVWPNPVRVFDTELKAWWGSCFYGQCILKV